ncbi:MAG: hypothetical protein RLY66_670 [Candidatus Parcubacteria bacterium]|jgi:hypothetical protein
MRTKLRLIYIVVGFLLAVAGVFLISKVQTARSVTWQKHRSLKMGVSFEYPKGWEILFDTSEYTANPVLCPPESERIEARYLYMNCITFRQGDRVRAPASEMEGDNGVFLSFSDIINPSTDKVYHQYRAMNYNPNEADFAINMAGIYRNGSADMIGMWQSMCAINNRDSCLHIFAHVLNSLIFIKD